MHKRLFGVLMAVVFLFLTTTAHAVSEDILGDMTKKLKRGIINTVTGCVEFPLQIIKGFDEGFRGDRDNKLLGVVWGVFDGIEHSIGRTISGVTEIVGFWAIGPAYEEGIGIPLDAEYAWETGLPHDPFDPSFTEGSIGPMVNKFFRGAGNAIFGFMEIPGQIAKGASRGAPDFGVIKGLWYWASREVSGISDIVTAPFASPEYPVGPTFDQDWPWEILTEDEGFQRE